MPNRLATDRRSGRRIECPTDQTFRDAQVHLHGRRALASRRSLRSPFARPSNTRNTRKGARLVTATFAARFQSSVDLVAFDANTRPPSPSRTRTPPTPPRSRELLPDGTVSPTVPAVPPSPPRPRPHTVSPPPRRPPRVPVPPPPPTAFDRRRRAGRDPTRTRATRRRRRRVRFSPRRAPPSTASPRTSRARPPAREHRREYPRVAQPRGEMRASNRIRILLVSVCSFSRLSRGWTRPRGVARGRRPARRLGWRRAGACVRRRPPRLRFSRTERPVSVGRVRRRRRGARAPARCAGESPFAARDVAAGAEVEERAHARGALRRGPRRRARERRETRIAAVIRIVARKTKGVVEQRAADRVSRIVGTGQRRSRRGNAARISSG